MPVGRSTVCSSERSAASEDENPDRYGSDVLTNRDYQLVTPEAVVLELATAGVGSRLVAFIIDAAVQSAAVFALFMAVFVAGDPGGGSEVFAAVVVGAGLFIVLLGYPAIFETAWRGRTPGKAALGLRVVTSEGSPVRFRHAAVRAALALVDFYATGGAAAILSILITRNDQRLGDLAAGTLVVRERTGAVQPHAIRFTAPSGLEDYVASLDVSAMTPDHYVAVRTFLLRAATLPPGVRNHLANQFAEPLAARMNHTPPESVSAETFLTCAVAKYQERSAPAVPAPPPPPPAPSRARSAVRPPEPDTGFAPPS